MMGFKCRISFKSNSPKGLFLLGEKRGLVKEHKANSKWKLINNNM